jgi:hypothetical protein
VQSAVSVTIKHIRVSVLFWSWFINTAVLYFGNLAPRLNNLYFLFLIAGFIAEMLAL